ncbi:hypothetical protein BSL78_26415 [Apostichopus japonicus]|uniref:Reverse transcriptase domain-containing protein n=1 Tax=Stichopus japonicus TaxID=307972 RepID=A0A2G8JLU5_STIJA|nr:hypothetical protein BSL78_26415 [Apostichopus japonicus]
MVVADTSEEGVPLRLLNPSAMPVTIYKGTTVARVMLRSSGATRRMELAEHMRDLAERSCCNLNTGQRERVTEIMAELADVFAKSPENLGRTNLVKHRIDIGNAKPIRQAARRLPIHQKVEAQKEINRMLRENIIEPSSSSWSSPVVLVKKKDGYTRFCVDYRKLDAVTTKDCYSLPRINDSLESLAGSRWFSTLDLASGYWQVELEEGDRRRNS